MKYFGFVLYAAIFLLVAFMPAARAFFLDSWSLAPEITALVAIAYTYVVALTILLTVFPGLSKNRSLLYDTHLKMACSVMVSLGLVGTFLGLVDMIAGIAKALGGEDSDFSARMALLLEAIASSLGAMSFAFMTSILGVGISAYSMIAGTFVLSSLKEEEEKASSKAVAEPEPAKGDALILEELSQRIGSVETEVAIIRVLSAEQEIVPPALLHEIVQQGERTDQKHQLLVDQIASVAHQFANLANTLDDLSSRLTKTDRDEEALFEQLQRIETTLVSSNVELTSLDASLNEVKQSAGDFVQRIRKLFS